MLGNQHDKQLLIEPISGWRAWNVTRPTRHWSAYERRIHEHLFISPQQGDTWTDGKLDAFDACLCLHLTAPPLDRLLDLITEPLLCMPNMRGCLCGVNAFDTRERLLASSYLAYAAVGRVELSGTVRQFRKGWRASSARIAEVWATSPEHADAVRAAAERSGATYRGVIAEHAQIRSRNERAAKSLNASVGLLAPLACLAALWTVISVGRQAGTHALLATLAMLALVHVGGRVGDALANRPVPGQLGAGGVEDPFDPHVMMTMGSFILLVGTGILCAFLLAIHSLAALG